MQTFNKIGILGKQDDTQIIDTLRLLRQYLIQHDYDVQLDPHAGKALELDYVETEELAQSSDLAIVVGGDGTLLTAGRIFASYDVPVLGINLGRLGFLVDISPNELITQLEKILQGEYHEEQRGLLYAEAYRDTELLGSGKALNDVVIHARTQVRMIEFTTHIDGKFVNTQRADGLVVSTPTGSTAYALSGGGPILHPNLDAVVLVPICPHTLSHRPLVISHNSMINIQLGTQRSVESRLSFDGHYDIDLESGDHIIIRPLEDKLRLLHPTNYDYYNILRAKLHWGVQL